MIHAWHFLPENERLHFPHYGQHRLIKPGSLLTVKPPLKLCEHGLHASIKPLYALCYAQGPVICRVDCYGEVIQDESKLVCERRRVIWMANITRELHEFACRSAAQVLKAANITNEHCWRAIETKRAWLNGQVADEELTEAQDKVNLVSLSGHSNTVWNAVRSAVHATGLNSVVCAWLTYRAAQYNIGFDDQNTELERILAEIK